VYECSNELVGNSLLSVRLTHCRTRHDFVITSVYGPCNEGRRADLWQELHGTRGWAAGPWLIGGYFNVTRYFGERIVSEIHISGMRGFNDLIRSLSLVEPPIRIVLTHGQVIGNHLRKLDRFLFSLEWEDQLTLFSSCFTTYSI